VLAAATLHPETDEADVRFALRVLSENLHAAVVLWRQWLDPQEGGAAVAED
jgi:hypothetical protein